ncbi:MAG: Cys-tRNA(Pro) deacylase [Desulfuromonadaceae bacterium]|nr:Cys-tRNA(Pro) deacylase [Desulfuromonadaceae bacterium]MDD5104732.1 Cys-tRNA(Pro) deacylase [Desulfuromonadaceae bacterium]
MAKEKTPITAAIRLLRAEQVVFSDHLYDYEDKGGTSVSSRALGVDEHSVIKTLVMEDEKRRPLVVLMHGDLQVSTKELARIIGVKQILPCSAETAQKQSGYMVGGTSPFGMRHTMPVYMEESISGLTKIYINGGKRGYLVGMEPAELIRVLKPVAVTVGIR